MSSQSCSSSSSEKKAPSLSILRHLVSKITATGPITVAEYMREVLTNPVSVGVCVSHHHHVYCKTQNSAAVYTTALLDWSESIKWFSVQLLCLSQVYISELIPLWFCFCNTNSFTGTCLVDSRVHWLIISRLKMLIKKNKETCFCYRALCNLQFFIQAAFLVLTFKRRRKIKKLVKEQLFIAIII